MPESRYTFTMTLNEKQIHELHELYQGEWWTQGRSLDDVRTMLQRSDFLFAFYDESDGQLVAFARVLTDTVFKAFIFDVIVAPQHRDEGLGRRLMERILQHSDLRKVSHFELYCLPELVPFYEKLGFSTNVSGVCLMRKTVDDGQRVD
jgi:predicted GNAT family N-acyltransferase